ncbi:hypothetical protein SO802_032011 [Lithocarpus litseifolius]|uniref:Uncharacterized protein n=1 Tax=Lithocarpus litseifolius TaxID=425828 RepID=A0AAW2BSN7_9ROSI
MWHPLPDDQLKEAIEDANREKALKDVAMVIAKDKGKATEKRVKVFEKARALAKQKLAKIDVKLRGTELKLAEAESLNLAQADEIADLKVAFEAYEDKWYNAGFTEVENFVEPIIFQQAMGEPNDFPLWNPEQIPFLEPPPPSQNPSNADDEEETPSMKELVHEIDSHVESIDLKHSVVIIPLGKLSFGLHTPETDLGADGNQIDGMPLHSHLPHLLTLLHALRGLFSNACLLSPTPNLIPIYTSARVPYPSCQSIHAWRRPILSCAFEMTPLLDQTVLPPACTPYLHAFSAFFPAN